MYDFNRMSHTRRVRLLKYVNHLKTSSGNVTLALSYSNEPAILHLNHVLGLNLTTDPAKSAVPSF
jgi:hypothetical protein